MRFADRRRRLPSLLLFALALLAALCAPLTAVANDEVAKKQFQKAQELYDTGDYAVALPLFKVALETSNSPNARLYVARCERELGSMVTAYNQLSVTFADAERLAPSQAKYERTRDAARKELAALEEKVARITVVVSGADAADLTVTINNEPRAAAMLSVPFAITSGEVTVEATSDATEPARTTVSVELGDLKNASLEIVTKQVDKPDEPPPPEEKSDGLSVVQIAGIAVGVIGVGGFVMMGVTGSMAQSKLDELDSDCGGQRCSDPAAADTVDEGEMLALLSNVGLAVGIAGVAAGAAMLIFGGDLLDDDESAASLWIAPAGTSLHVGGRF